MDNGGENTASRRRQSVVGRKRKFRFVSKMMEESQLEAAGRRNWADLEMDCLIYVFGRIGMESLLLSVPFVCKSWHKATLDPMCWQHLSFPEYLPLRRPKGHGPELFYYKFLGKCIVNKNTTFSIDSFVKMVVARSHGKAVEIKLPGFTNEGTLRYVSDSCPQLRVLCLPDDIELFKHSRVISKLIGKWKLLEQLHLGGNLKKIDTYYAQLYRPRTNGLFAVGENCACQTILDEILVQIGIHCKHFLGLGLAHVDVDEEQVSTIVKSLPNLKYLWLQESHFKRDFLVAVVKGCKQLEVLEVTPQAIDDGDMEAVSNLAKDYGVEFLWQGGGDSGKDGVYNGLASLSQLRCLLLNKDRVGWMSTGGVAPRKQLARKETKIMQQRMS